MELGSGSGASLALAWAGCLGDVEGRRCRALCAAMLDLLVGQTAQFGRLWRLPRHLGFAACGLGGGLLWSGSAAVVACRSMQLGIQGCNRV